MVRYFDNLLKILSSSTQNMSVTFKNFFALSQSPYNTYTLNRNRYVWRYSMSRDIPGYIFGKNKSPCIHFCRNPVPVQENAGLKLSFDIALKFWHAVTGTHDRCRTISTLRFPPYSIMPSMRFSYADITKKWFFVVLENSLKTNVSQQLSQRFAQRTSRVSMLREFRNEGGVTVGGWGPLGVGGGHGWGMGGRRPGPVQHLARPHPTRLFFGVQWLKHSASQCSCVARAKVQNVLPIETQLLVAGQLLALN
jgi:hypothetical protein